MVEEVVNMPEFHGREVREISFDAFEIYFI